MKARLRGGAAGGTWRPWLSKGLASASPAGRKWEYADSVRDGIIQLKPENGKARRTVWLRRDGSTLELLRQNDVPANLPFAILGLPVSILLGGFPFIWGDMAHPTFSPSTDRWPDIPEAQLQDIVNQKRTSGTHRHPREHPE